MNKIRESEKFRYTPWKYGLNTKTFWQLEQRDFNIIHNAGFILPVAMLRYMMVKYDE